MNLLLNEEDKDGYIMNQIESINKMIENLDKRWIHYKTIKSLLEDTLNELKKIKFNNKTIQRTHERKIEKYINWVEVYRLANYHFSRYLNSKTSYSEGLFSTLLALNNMYIHDKSIKNIGIIGCGPGRSVLDFSLAYPNAKIHGLDYSSVALTLGKKIVSSCDKEIEIVRREDNIIIDKINGFKRNNCLWSMFDLTKSNIKEEFDIAVCSNVINLMPNHKEAINKIYNMITPNGYIIYADLTGWRIDRKEEQELLKDKDSIKKCFEDTGFVTIECFDGGPYVEKENDSNFIFYKQTYYIGRKCIK